MVQKKRLSENIEEFKERLEELEAKIPGEKKFKTPKLGKAKLKKGYVIVFLMKENNYWEFRKLPVVNGNINLGKNKEDTYHLADAEYIGMCGKFPMIVLPSWSNEPITKEVLTRKVDVNKSTIKPQKQIIHLMEDARIAEETKPKKSMKGIVMIMIVIIAIYVIGRGQGWF